MKLSFALVFVVVFSHNLVLAQHRPGSAVLVFNVGSSQASVDDAFESGDAGDLSGNLFSLSYERTNPKGNLAAGVAISYLSTSADSLDSSGTEVGRLNSVSFNVLPVLLYGKAMFGPPKLKGYLSAGFGVQFSNASSFTDAVQVESYDSGFLVGGSAGVMFFLSEKILFNAAYNFSFLANSFYRDGTVGTFAVGLGYQIF
jgi:hypothetical protein